jgi:hypothetical protein
MPAELKQVLVLSLLNPATILVGVLVGRIADQVQKIVVGAFLAALAGVASTLIAARLGLPAAEPRTAAGMFVVSWVVGLFWSWVGFKMRDSVGSS